MMRIPELRTRHGLSQQDVADAIGNMPVATYRKYEYGQRQVPMSTLFALADYYGVSIDYLVGHDPRTCDPAAAETDIRRAITANIRRLAEESGMDQLKVAAACGVSNSLVSRWFSGVESVSIDYIPTLARALSVSIDGIFADVNQSSSPLSFYEALVIAMDRKRMTPSDVCKKAGLYPFYISKLKIGHMRSVSWENAIAIVNALGMTPNEFYEIQYGPDTR